MLNLINQGEPLFALRLGEVTWWKIGLTYLVPFCVSVFSAARIRMLATPDAVAPRERRLLERAYAAFNARDVGGALAGMHADVEWPNGWEGGVVRGHAEVRDYWTRQWQAIDPSVHPVAFRAEGDGRVAVEVRQVVRDLEGKLLRDDVVLHVYRIEDGLVRSMEIRPGG